MRYELMVLSHERGYMYIHICVYICTYTYTCILQFEKLPKDLSNVAVRSRKALNLAHILVLCRDSVVVTLAQLTHPCSALVKG